MQRKNWLLIISTVSNETLECNLSIEPKSLSDKVFSGKMGLIIPKKDHKSIFQEMSIHVKYVRTKYQT